MLITKLVMASPVDVSSLDRWVTQARSRRGAVLCIRPLRPDDRLLDQLMDIDYRQRMAFVATTQQDGVQQVVGVARYCQTDDDGTAELGVSVAALRHCKSADGAAHPLCTRAGHSSADRAGTAGQPADDRAGQASCVHGELRAGATSVLHVARAGPAQPSQVAAASCCSMHPRRASGAS